LIGTLVEGHHGLIVFTYFFRRQPHRRQLQRFRASLNRLELLLGDQLCQKFILGWVVLGESVPYTEARAQVRRQDISVGHQESFLLDSLLVLADLAGTKDGLPRPIFEFNWGHAHTVINVL
jgi:hypothetical protein